MLLVFHPGPGDPDRNGSGHLFRPVWQRWCLEAALPTVARDLQPRRFKRTGKSTCWRMGWLPVRREFRGKLGCNGLPERQNVVLIHLTVFKHCFGEIKISFFCFYFQYQCCGVDSWQDWNKNPHFDPNRNPNADYRGATDYYNNNRNNWNYNTRPSYINQNGRQVVPQSCCNPSNQPVRSCRSYVILKVELNSTALLNFFQVGFHMLVINLMISEPVCAEPDVPERPLLCGVFSNGRQWNWQARDRPWNRGNLSLGSPTSQLPVSRISMSASADL